MSLLRNIYLTRLFFLLFFIIVGVFALAAVMPYLFSVAQIGFLVLIGLTIIDFALMAFVKRPIEVERRVKNKMSLGDRNPVQLIIKNKTLQPISFSLFEGFPVEMQEREHKFSATIGGKKSQEFQYEFSPKKRGDVKFTSPTFFVSSIFNLTMRRIVVPLEETVSVYPSVLQMKKYELEVFSNQKVSSGVKRVRRLGNNSEFEQIKNYVQGDEIKTVNWKATSRQSSLMVNKYQEEKSQSIYCILDKSRSMQMEFEGLSLLDYAVNSILVLSNIMLKNGDKTGLITFSNKMGTQIPAEKGVGQMRGIMEALYNQKTEFLEPNYELLYQSVRRSVKTRSLIVLFTNFETEAALMRALPILRKINQRHVLVTVLFQNSDIEKLALEKPESMRDVYQSIVAEDLTTLKSRLALKLKQNGINAVLTLPENLSIQTINKYLELKAKGVL